ncbi:hypothetical protein HDV02_004421 [Globomyces sp. JEL0801]|nr:hypothetical protein HDV02_004421 [Globomyces sp. JEL0801]
MKIQLLFTILVAQLASKPSGKFPDRGFCPINGFGSQGSTESPTDDTLQGFLQVRKELLQEMLVLYKEYRKLYSYKQLFENELNQIALREKQRTDSGFRPNQGCYMYHFDELLETRHNCERNMLEHQNDDQRKREIHQMNNDAQMLRVIKNKFEVILTLQDGISNLDGLIEMTKSPTQ